MFLSLYSRRTNLKCDEQKETTTAKFKDQQSSKKLATESIVRRHERPYTILFTSVLVKIFLLDLFSFKLNRSNAGRIAAERAGTGAVVGAA